MLSSSDRILTTHCGSLPRSPQLTELLLRQEEGAIVDLEELKREAAAGVERSVKQQLSSGVDIVSDGEQPRVGYATYIPMRMRGFGGVSNRTNPRDIEDFPKFMQMRKDRFKRKSRSTTAPQAISDVCYENLGPASAECAMFKSALIAAGVDTSRSFMTSASPGAIASVMSNAHYDTRANYLHALAQEMRKEYELIASEGFVLQLDSPDLGVERSFMFKDKSNAEFRQAMEIHIDALNSAVANIPKSQIRLHVCWGNWEGPHIHDVALQEILPLIYRAKVGALSIEFANPRHQHEYKALKQNPPPDDVILIPGVIDTTTNFVEHPEVVANRICEAVDAMGGDMTKVIAGTDCGFGSSAGAEHVAEDVVWAKLATLREGSDIATRRLKA